MEAQKGIVGVTLTGQGADEGLAGYEYFYGFYFKYLLLKLKLFTLIREFYHYFKNHKSLFGFKTFLLFSLTKKDQDKIKTSTNNFLDLDFSAKYKNYTSPAGNVYNAANFDSFYRALRTQTRTSFNME